MGNFKPAIVWSMRLADCQWKICLHTVKSAETGTAAFHRDINEFDEKLLKKDNVFLSSKKNTHLHGIGMKSIQTAVEKYHGSMKVDVKENKFKLLILFCFRDVDLD